MITFLSGGTGTPKLLRGMQKEMGSREISVVVNTAEDIEISGGHISPDIDTVMYLFAGVLNTETWWGIKSDTFTTHDEITTRGFDEFIAIGDRDRAVHIARANMLKGGMRLTEITRTLCEQFGVKETVLPMTDSTVTTMIRTADGLLHYQEYWVREKGRPQIQQIIRNHVKTPVATPEVLSAISMSDAVVIGPSNPITSILPILECEGVREVLKEKFVLAVSPFIGNAPVSGPAAALMQASGYAPTSQGTLDCYRDLVDVFIQDLRDPVDVKGAKRFDTLMTGEEKSVGLARAILTLVKTGSGPAIN
jgi:LPPG:FO 2-phospho-L-lactate transferase